MTSIFNGVLEVHVCAKFRQAEVQRFMSYRVNRETEKREKKLSDDAENNTAVASAGSN